MSFRPEYKGNAYWEEKSAAVGRRAFEHHVLELIREGAPLEEAVYKDAHGREDNPLFREAELVGEYPKTRVRIRMYDRIRDLETIGNYLIWDRDFATRDFTGEGPPDLKDMRPPHRPAGDMMIWARGG